MPRDVFICFHHEDQTAANQVVRSLETAGMRCWISSRDELPGETWAAKISRALDESKTVVFILSAKSNNSDGCKNELAIAHQKKKPIIPLRVENVYPADDLEYFLARVQRLDALSRPIDQYLDELVAAVRNSIKVKPEQPPRELPPELPLEEPRSLVKILPGVWQIQITHPSGMVGQMGLELSPSGAFQGQLIAPAGQLMIQGMWQITSPNQVALQGQQSNGFMMWPYGVVLTFNNVAPNQLSGLSDVGEQVVCQKV
jgi:hypothetical protein